MKTGPNQICLSYGNWVWIILLSTLFLISPFSISTAYPAVTERYIVILSDDVDPAKAEGVASELIIRHQAVPEHIYTHAIKGFSASIPVNRVSALLSDPRVNNVVADWQIEAFCHASMTQELPTGVNLIDADLSATAGINNTDNPLDLDIAILDTGIYPHQDLNIFASVNCITKGGCKVVTPGDKNGHGTHVAGIAAARDNNRAVVGAAPGARLWMVKVLNDNGSGFASWLIAGIDYVTNNAPSKVEPNAASIEVANMSLGGLGTDTGNCGVSSDGRVNDPLHKAICNSIASGVTYSVAAGNETQDAANVTPAAYPEVITVSALADSNGQLGGLGPATSSGADDAFAAFSNFGAGVDLVAPGVDIFSTLPGDRRTPQGFCGIASGTSMASPHAAGAAGLYIRSEMSKGLPRPAPDAVRDALRSFGRCPDGSVFGLGPCSTGWPGDPDEITEPLINVSGF